MNRWFALLLAVLAGGCASISEHRYGYAGDERHGGYYYDREPVQSGLYVGSGWYDPYDSVFWGLRYNYFDPFWYPGFYYGVTYFPRYYYPFGPWDTWYAGWYRPWRYGHPYSPYWGSYWDHYYAGHWHRPPTRDPIRRPGTRPGGGRDSGWADDGIPRFGSARNAAERAAAQVNGRGQVRAPADRVMTSRGWRGSETRAPIGAPPARGVAPMQRSGRHGAPAAPVSRPRSPAMPSSSGRGGVSRGAAPRSMREPTTFRAAPDRVWPARPMAGSAAAPRTPPVAGRDTTFIARQPARSAPRYESSGSPPSRASGVEYRAPAPPRQSFPSAPRSGSLGQGNHTRGSGRSHR